MYFCFHLSSFVISPFLPSFYTASRYSLGSHFLLQPSTGFSTSQPSFFYLAFSSPFFHSCLGFIFLVIQLSLDIFMIFLMCAQLSIHPLVLYSLFLSSLSLPFPIFPFSLHSFFSFTLIWPL